MGKITVFGAGARWTVYIGRFTAKSGFTRKSDASRYANKLRAERAAQAA
jgi:hypothetical protein